MNDSVAVVPSLGVSARDVRFLARCLCELLVADDAPSLSKEALIDRTIDSVIVQIDALLEITDQDMGPQQALQAIQHVGPALRRAKSMLECAQDASETLVTLLTPLDSQAVSE